MIELFTGPTCPKCTIAKELLEKNNIKYTEVMVNTPEAREKAIKFKIMQAPSLLIDENEVIAGLVNIQKYII